MADPELPLYDVRLMAERLYESLVNRRLPMLLGLAGAFFTARYIETQLFGVRALDPIVIASGAAILAAVSFVAVSIPARRAARVNPVSALAGD